MDEDTTLQQAARRPRRHADRPAPPLDEDEDWSTERDDPTFGTSPTQASSSGRPLGSSAAVPAQGSHKVPDDQSVEDQAEDPDDE